MTDKQLYRRRKNTQARIHGGPLVCPESLHVLDRTEHGYHCPACNWDWAHDGSIIKEVAP